METLDRPAAVTRVRAAALARTRGHAPEILAYCAVRVLGLIVLAAMAKHPGHLTSLLSKWDGSFYLQIARHGYDTALTYRPDGTLVNTDIVFFPLFPFLTAVLGAVLGIVPAALLISLAAGIVAGVVAMCGIGEHLYDKRTGVYLAALWGLPADRRSRVHGVPRGPLHGLRGPDDALPPQTPLVRRQRLRVLRGPHPPDRRRHGPHDRRVRPGDPAPPRA